MRIDRSNYPLWVTIFVLMANEVVSGNFLTMFSNFQTHMEALSKLFRSFDEDKLVLPNPQQLEDAEYDLVIVGSGSAGSVIANRLSEIAQWNVLLLEAGYPENALAQYPALTPMLQFTDYNWNFVTEPQNNACLAMEGRRCAWPRGKALGGTSVINYMIYTRGAPANYDRWAALGNPGWSYEQVLPYFLKSEDAHLDRSNPDYHNQGGYQSVEYCFQSELSKTFLKAGKELGYDIIDYNSLESLGFSNMQSTMKRGRRHSVARAFLSPILRRKNLKILVGAHVTKILLNPVTKKALGVNYVKNGRKISVYARKEVIISAGVIGSPQLLMLSGIGPEKHLSNIGIKPVHNLPVGETLYDHTIYLGLICDVNATVQSLSDLIDPAKYLKWYNSGEGPLASVGGVDSLAFIKTNVSQEKGDNPDVELILNTVDITTDYGLISRRIFSISADYYYKMYLDKEGKPGFTLMPVVLHPKSKGHLKLKSYNPYDPPLIYANYLSDPEGYDLKTLIAGIRFGVELCEADAFKKYDARVNTKPVLGCERLPFNSDEYWGCAARHLSSTLYHQTSTCRMGAENDTEAVVDHELKVHGFGNLRVADASIFPFVPGAHTNAPTIMVGEKASDLIKSNWGVL